MGLAKLEVEGDIVPALSNISQCPWDVFKRCMYSCHIVDIVHLNFPRDLGVVYYLLF